jgi:hypothetical protein
MSNLLTRPPRKSSGRRRVGLARDDGSRALGPVLGFGSAFRQMSLARDHLEVREAPVSEQLWPRFPSVLPPHVEERHAVVDFRHRRQAPPAHGAAKPLNTFQDRRVEMRGGPEFPRDRAGLVPSRARARASVAPQVAMPSVAKDRLAANTAGSMSSRECRFPKRGRRRSEVGRQPVPAVHVEGPGPTRGRPAQSREGSGQALRAQRVRLPVGGNRPRQGLRHHLRGKCMAPDRVRKWLGDVRKKPIDSPAVAALAPIGPIHPRRTAQRPRFRKTLRQRSSGSALTTICPALTSVRLGSRAEACGDGVRSAWQFRPNPVGTEAR